MKILKIAMVLAAIALMTSPAWASPGHGQAKGRAEHGPSTVPVGPPSTTPNAKNNPGSAHRSPRGQENAGGGKHGGANRGRHGGASRGRHNHPARPPHPSHSRRCTPHSVAYVAAGTLLSQTLSKDAGANTYSGSLAVAVKRTNRHAAADRSTTVTYKVEHVRITFALADINHDGSVGLDDVQTNDRVRLIGAITSLGKKCDQSGFTATTTIAHIVLHPPVHS